MNTKPAKPAKPGSVTELIEAIETEMATPHKMAELRVLRKKFSTMLENQYGSVVIRIALSLLRKRVPSARYMAYELIVNHPKAPSMVGSKELFRLGANLDSKEAVDMFALYLVGPAWRDGRVHDELIHYWAKLAIRWWKRLALVSTVPLNSKEHGGLGEALHVVRTLIVCSMLIDDRDELVMKAMSSALKEANEVDPKTVGRFIHENQARLAPQVLSELGIKTEAGKKAPKAAK